MSVAVFSYWMKDDQTGESLACYIFGRSPAAKAAAITSEVANFAHYRFPLHASFNGSGDIWTYLVVLAIEAWPILVNTSSAIKKNLPVQ